MMTMEETRLYQFDTETNQQSIQWAKRLTSPPKNTSVKIHLKTLISIFCDHEGVLLIAYVLNVLPTNVEY